MTYGDDDWRRQQAEDIATAFTQIILLLSAITTPTLLALILWRVW